MTGSWSSCRRPSLPISDRWVFALRDRGSRWIKPGVFRGIRQVSLRGCTADELGSTKMQNGKNLEEERIRLSKYAKMRIESTGLKTKSAMMHRTKAASVLVAGARVDGRGTLRCITL
ncbi:hypothetical protein LIA77_05751 [Sarocladium implicatum]|nr:hypothetical protein LIA77_05751 [Sarocladium implicatum]